MPLTAITTQTPDGEFHIIIDDTGVARTSGFGTLEALIQRLPENLRDLPIETTTSHKYITLVQAYYAGDKKALDAIPRRQEGSPFQIKVWDAISTIDYGKTLSYKELANASGNPAAIRPAGTICGLNRLILLIPCHRVLKSDGSIGSYLYGPDLKQSLLQHEGAIS